MRTMGQHIRDVFTLADKPQLLTDPDPSPEQAAKIAESARFNFTLWIAFAVFWTVIGIKELLHRQSDDTVLGFVNLAAALGLVFLARKYYLLMRKWSERAH